MNKYGALLMRQWRRADPERFSEIPDPESFFAEKGQELEQEIDALAQSLAGPDRPGESYLEKIGAALERAVQRGVRPDPGGDDPGARRVETPLPAEWRSLAWEDPADE